MPRRGPGNSIRFFHGLVVIGPDFHQFLLTNVILLIPTVLFFVFVSPYMYDHVSKAIPFIAAALFWFAYASMLRTTFTEPGVIPRMKEFDENDTRLYQTLTVNGHEVRTKWCETCKRFRPPRAVHCSICNNCVEHMDHHCPWLSQCVGRRNYRYFFMFLNWLFVYILYTLAFSIVHLIMVANDHGGSFEDIGHAPGTIIVVIISGMAMFPVGFLTIFHWTLVSSNQTTNEKIMNRFEKNPYDLGCVHNILQVLCGPQLPSAW
eukprot:Colp12_sorted_trinity150504_noHs@27076